MAIFKIENKVSQLFFGLYLRNTLQFNGNGSGQSVDFHRRSAAIHTFEILGIQAIVCWEVGLHVRKVYGNIHDVLPGRPGILQDVAHVPKHRLALDGNVVESRTLDEPPQLPDLSDMMAEESQIEAVEQTEASWKEIYRNALSNQKSMSGVKEVYNAIREISDADPDDAIWAEQLMKARLVEIGK